MFKFLFLTKPLNIYQSEETLSSIYKALRVNHVLPLWLNFIFLLRVSKLVRELSRWRCLTCYLMDSFVFILTEMQGILFLLCSRRRVTQTWKAILSWRRKCEFGRCGVEGWGMSFYAQVKNGNPGSNVCREWPVINSFGEYNQY